MSETAPDITAAVGAAASRAAERSPSVRRSRLRTVKHTEVLIDATRRLITEHGERFTIQDVVKEAGVALQTFYRSFAGKDELLLAVIEDTILDACVRFAANVADIPDPVERLAHHIDAVFDERHRGDGGQGARFVVSQRARLSRLYPEAAALATKPFTDLLEAEIAVATETGQLHSSNPARDAWLITQLVLSVYHQNAFETAPAPALAADVWQFCLHGLDGNEATDA